MIDRDLGLGLGLGRDRLFGGISVSAEIANFSAENRDRFKGKVLNIFNFFFSKFFLCYFLVNLKRSFPVSVQNYVN